MVQWMIALMGVLMCAATPASALDFGFSFTDSEGTVSGRILGLADDTSGQAATSIILDTYPEAYLGTVGDSPAPGGWGVDAVLWQTVVVNSFAVAGGMIVDMEFFAATGTSVDGIGHHLLLDAGVAGGDFPDPYAFYMLRFDGVGDGCQDLCRVVGSDTIDTAVVPEPSAALVFAVGLGVVGAANRSRSRRHQ